MTATSPAARFVDKPAVLIIVAAALLLIPAWLNGFPFIFPDSTDYLTMAPQLHRPPFYGLFITFFHWNHFIWAPVIMQSLLVSHLLWLLMRLTSGRPRAEHFLPFMLVLTGFSSLPFFTGFIMADIFTPVMFLCCYILCFHHQQLSGLLRYYVFLLACIATVVHITNLSLGLGLCILLTLLLTLARAPMRARLQALGRILLPVVLSMIAILLCNGLVLHTWKIGPAGQSFFMANLIEYGPARDYLDESCPSKHYRICAYRPYPPTANELLWVDNSIFWRLGGFAGMREEAAEIVRETIRTRPHDVAWVLWDNFLAGLKTHTPAAEFYPNFCIPAFRDLVHKKFGAEALAALDTSAEVRDTIPHTALIAIDDIVTPASFFLLLAMAAAHARSRSSTGFILPVATLCFILGNVILCTALSGVHDRYQSRLTWLMPMVLGLLFVEHLKKRHTLR